MDHLRQDVRVSLGNLRHRIERLRQMRREGPLGWVDDERRTAEGHWADWALRAAREAHTDIQALDLPKRRDAMTELERKEVDDLRREVSDMFAFFTRTGGQLLPRDMPGD